MSRYTQLATLYIAAKEAYYEDKISNIKYKEILIDIENDVIKVDSIIIEETVSGFILEYSKI